MPLKSAPSRAPWRQLFQSHISTMPALEFALSTVFDDGRGTVLPRVRTCIFRGFWGELELRDSARETLLGQQGRSDRAEDERGINPSVYESDMLAFTSDVRMEKVRQITSCGSKDTVGGPVEALFWAKEVMKQWRIRGNSFVIGGCSSEPGELDSRKRIERCMRRRDQPQEERSSNDVQKAWSWERAVTAQFANMSPIMRGSFKNPPPGTPISAPVSNPSMKLGQKVEDLYDPLARENFRVVVIIPEEVEMVDLSNPEEGKRIRWTLTEDNGEGSWSSVDLWP